MSVQLQPHSLNSCYSATSLPELDATQLEPFLTSSRLLHRFAQGFKSVTLEIKDLTCDLR